jgi:flagellar biosynthesis protein FlhB
VYLVKLNLQFFAGEKTEKATPKKRKDARKKGQTAKSQDINTAIGILAIFFFFSLSSEFIIGRILGIFKHFFQEYIGKDLTESNVVMIYIEVLMEVAKIVGPIMLVAVVAGVASNYLQIGFLFTTETIQFKLEKIDPIKGFKRIFSLRSVIEFLKSILKILIVSIITFLVLWNRLDEILILSQKTIGAALVTLVDLTVQMGLYAGGALLFLALLDYLYQKFDFEKNIRMSKQDIKDEYKNMEGDPQIKSKIKQKQREMAMSRMMQEVPGADVIITNPTHYAVALKYDESKFDAPYVVAKGVDFMAQKIKYIAKENDVMMVENRPLARTIYGQTDIGDTIPEDLFKAVAEILAYVYRTKNIMH